MNILDLLSFISDFGWFDRLYIGTSLAVLTFLVLMIRFCVDVFLVQAKPWSNAYVQDFVSFIIIGITILVVAVPEGLPLAVILALAYSIKVGLWPARNLLNKSLEESRLIRSIDVLVEIK